MKIAKMKTAATAAAKPTKTTTRTTTKSATTTNHRHNNNNNNKAPTDLHFLHTTMSIGELKRQQKSATAAAAVATPKPTTRSPTSSASATWTWSLSKLLADMPKTLPTSRPPPILPPAILPKTQTLPLLSTSSSSSSSLSSLSTFALPLAAAATMSTSHRQFNLHSSADSHHHRVRHHHCGHRYAAVGGSWRTTLHYLLAMTLLCLMAPMADAIINCPIGCTCNDVSLVVTCSEGTLDVVPITLNPSIQRLIITNSKKIRTFDSSIQFYYDLNYLDLSHNELVNIPADTFKMQGKLQELNLSHNKIGQINNKTFNGLASLTVLNLRGNLLAELERATFATVVKIAELNLGANRISTIDAHAFDGLVNLRVLYLDDNTLTTLPAPATFMAMPSLAELYLGTNSFESLPAGVFGEVKGLTRLDLRSAGLVFNITADAFVGLEGLRALDLTDNRLQQVPTLALSRLQRLEELSLGQNDFEVILPGAFAGLKNLKRLELTGGQRLARIANGAFAENTNLEQLNCSGNKILNIIEEQALRGLPNLRHVNLRENQLSTLAEGLFPWSDLESLDLSDNPFVCDCHVLWLRNLLVSTNESNYRDLAAATTPKHKIANVNCFRPSQFQGVALAQLSPAVLGCASGGGNSQALIGVVVVGVTIILSLIGLLIYSCRRRIRELLKGGWGNSALGRKEREYQKTFSDEEYMTRQRHPCLGTGVGVGMGVGAGNVGMHTQLPATAPYANDTLPGTYHAGGYMDSRPIPVTEL